MVAVLVAILLESILIFSFATSNFLAKNMHLARATAIVGCLESCLLFVVGVLFWHDWQIQIIFSLGIGIHLALGMERLRNLQDIGNTDQQVARTKRGN
mgnify:CR=1 FL=1